MMPRTSSRGGSKITQALIEEGVEEEESEVAAQIMPGKQQEPVIQNSDTMTVKVVQPVNHIVRPRQHFIRRSSSAVERVSLPPPPEEKKDGGDKSLRPRFLQERSATIVHITPPAADPSRAPRSKASAFLLGVLAKARGPGSESRRSSLEPLKPDVTNTLHYVPPQGVERGMPLRMVGRNSRRFGCQLSIGPSSDLFEKGIPEGARKRRVSASQEHIAAVIRALQASKQQVHQQLDILHSILRFINAYERDDEGKRPILKEMVDVGIIPELAGIMREFRFHTALQICVISILSALAEESSVYAYMMSEFNLERLLQKNAAVHASQDRLIMLASNLVHAIEDSKHTVNIPAYHAEKAARVRRQSATYTDMIVAAITAKPKQSLLSPSASRRSSTASCRRAPQAGIAASELARSRAMIKSAPSAEKSGPEHDSSQPVGQQRQSFALAVDPPKLSANYRLLFGQTLKKNEIQPLQLHQSSNSEVIEAGAQQERRDRPSSSPTKKSLPLELTSRSLATAIYSGGSIFVEPSPLSKRLPHRGSLSAGGVRRKLTVLKRVQRAQTEYLPSTKLASLDFVDHSTIVDKPKRSPQPVEPEAQEADATLSFRKNDEDENDASTGVITAEKEEQDEREDDEEAYEDDFDTTGDDEDTDKKMPTRDTTASDGELIDMLHDISAEDHSTSSPVTTLKLTEVKAATTIQRHVRGRLVRQAFTRPSSSSKTPVRPPEYKGPRRITSKREINGSNREARKRGKMTLSARAHRQVHSQGRDKFSRKQTIPRGASKAATSSACPANTVKMSSVGAQRQSSETNNQLSSPSKSPQLGEFSALKNATTSMNEVEPEQRAEEVKGPPDPEALKQIQALYAEGLQHHKENHLGLAIECYEKALVIPGGQDFASLHVNLGSALMAQNKFSEALEFFEQAKRIQPNNVKAMYNNSLALLHLNRPRKAQQLLRRVLELEPTHEKAIVALSHLRGSVRSPTAHSPTQNTM